MIMVLRFLILGLVVLGLSACGTKGKLKSPSQIEVMEAKKKAQAEKKARSEEDIEDVTLPQTDPDTLKKPAETAETPKEPK